MPFQLFLNLTIVLNICQRFEQIKLFIFQHLVFKLVNNHLRILLGKVPKSIHFFIFPAKPHGIANFVRRIQIYFFNWSKLFVLQICAIKLINDNLVLWSVKSFEKFITVWDSDFVFIDLGNSEQFTESFRQIGARKEIDEQAVEEFGAVAEDAEVLHI